MFSEVYLSGESKLPYISLEENCGLISDQRSLTVPEAHFRTIDTPSVVEFINICSNKIHSTIKMGDASCTLLRK